MCVRVCVRVYCLQRAVLLRILTDLIFYNYIIITITTSQRGTHTHPAAGAPRSPRETTRSGPHPEAHPATTRCPPAPAPPPHRPGSAAAACPAGWGSRARPRTARLPDPPTPLLLAAHRADTPSSGHRQQDTVGRTETQSSGQRHHQQDRHSQQDTVSRTDTVVRISSSGQRHSHQDRKSSGHRDRVIRTETESSGQRQSSGQRHSHQDTVSRTESSGYRH